RPYQARSPAHEWCRRTSLALLALPGAIPVIVRRRKAKVAVKRKGWRIVGGDLKVGGARASPRRFVQQSGDDGTTEALPAERVRRGDGEQARMVALELEQAAGDNGAVTADDRARVRQRIGPGAL